MQGLKIGKALKLEDTNYSKRAMCKISRLLNKALPFLKLNAITYQIKTDHFYKLEVNVFTSRVLLSSQLPT